MSGRDVIAGWALIAAVAAGSAALAAGGGAASAQSRDEVRHSVVGGRVDLAQLARHRIHVDLDASIPAEDAMTSENLERAVASTASDPDVSGWVYAVITIDRFYSHADASYPPSALRHEPALVVLHDRARFPILYDPNGDLPPFYRAKATDVRAISAGQARPWGLMQID